MGLLGLIALNEVSKNKKEIKKMQKGNKQWDINYGTVVDKYGNLTPQGKRKLRKEGEWRY